MAALAAAAGIGGGSGAVRADVRLPLLVSDGMVLQQKAPVRLYGKAMPGEKVTVSIQGKSAHATASKDGEWDVTLKSLAAGGPFTLTVAGKNRIEYKDVLVGEVWVCSGQSNMEWTLGGLPEAKDDIAAASDPLLRMFTVAKAVAMTPQPELAGGRWERATPESVPHFSAVGYYFARALRAALKVPVGMIHTSWGGTRIQAWTSKETLLANGVAASEFDIPDANDPAHKERLDHYERQLARWKAAGSPDGDYEDSGIAPAAADWAKPDFNDAGWSPIRVPGLWEEASIAELEALDGGVWFRREFDLPAGAAGKPATLMLGAVDDFDITYVNGVQVGVTGKEAPSSWTVARSYTVPAGILRTGKNVVAVRVWDHGGGGGFNGPAEAMHLMPEARGEGGEPVSLAGTWRYKVEVGRPQNPGAAPGLDPNRASVLYDGMLYALTKYTIKGGLWYQGESNAGEPDVYRRLLPAMIQDWRGIWGIKDFPFLIVQLAPFMDIRPEPQESDWARLREAQTFATTVLSNVGTAVIVDSGDEKDIHPHRKQPVGERLALLARKIAYGQDIVDEGPVFKGMKMEGDKAVLTFDDVGSGLEAKTVDTAGKPVRDGKLVGFAIAGADGKYVWADAVVSGKDTVTVSSPQVPNPVAVRYGWADFPVVNLWNKEGLPASPFRTDAPKENGTPGTNRNAR
jgi:sialate O-acetylesterase